MLNLNDAHFTYEPFPIGVIDNALEGSFYDELVRTYPSHEICKYMPKLGHKYSLSEVNNPAAYHQFIATHPAWKKFHDHVKSKAFIVEVLAFLKGRGIDLGLEISPAKRSLLGRMKQRLRQKKGLTARFEFSMLPVDGGHILPHTDSPGKYITLVFAMIDDSWDYAGGGTEMYRPKDTTKNFNYVNRYMKFEEMEFLQTLDFKKNSCAVFVKTFNSWHGVSPMTASGSKTLRKTLTINIERKGQHDY